MSNPNVPCFLHQGPGPFCFIILPDHLKPHLQRWTVESNVLDGVSLTVLTTSKHLFVDVSLQYWGAYVDGQVALGLWTASEQQWHINNLELEPLILALSHWNRTLQHAQINISMDNITVICSLRIQRLLGRTKSVYFSAVCAPSEGPSNDQVDPNSCLNFFCSCATCVI